MLVPLPFLRIAPWLVALGVSAAAQERPVAIVPRAPEAVEAPSIDGVPDEAFWDHAVVLDDFRQTVPIAGSAPSERTEVRLIYGERTLYVALHCFDRDPDGIVGTQRRRDARLDPDDSVELYFDTFLDRRNAFWFQIGPGGARGDALITKSGSSFNKRWDGIWQGRSRIDETGWTAELAIPAATLNFDPAKTEWGFNVRRFIRRRNEEVRWTANEPRLFFFNVDEGGTLSGITGLRQGIGLDVRPFAVGDYRRNREEPDTDRLADAGVDLFWRITPDTKLSVSVNTDFAETEVDQRQVNLTRFPLFFPEQRDFFLEDSGNFFFGPSSGGGGGGQDIIPFFSRRIGLDEDGGEIPITAAAKLTGQTDDWTFGVLDVQAGESPQGDADNRNLFVGRVSRLIGERSDAGLIFTHGNPSSEERNDTYGVDWNWRTNQFRGDENLRFSTYVLRADSEGVSEDELAYYARLSYPNDEIDARLEYLVVEENFDPALGFVRRRGIKQYEGRVSYRPRLNDGVVRRLDFELFHSLVTDVDNDVVTVDTRADVVGIQFESGDEWFVTLAQNTEVLDEPFEIADGVEIDAGRYDFLRYGTRFESAENRPIGTEIRLFTGGFFGGRRTDAELEVNYRPGPWGTFALEFEHNDVNLPGGDFDVNVGRVRANFQFGPDASWSNFVQWDTVSDSVGLNSRLWWIFGPGRELFLVLNQGWEFSEESFVATTTALAAKVGFTVRL